MHTNGLDTNPFLQLNDPLQWKQLYCRLCTTLRSKSRQKPASSLVMNVLVPEIMIRRFTVQFHTMNSPPQMYSRIVTDA
jgi:hypothetical protein